jgi:hypothetical protein
MYMTHLPGVHRVAIAPKSSANPVHQAYQRIAAALRESPALSTAGACPLVFKWHYREYSAVAVPTNATATRDRLITWCNGQIEDEVRADEGDDPVIDLLARKRRTTRFPW